MAKAVKRVLKNLSNHVNGKPTIGYGETSSKYIKMGKIDDATAKRLLYNNLRTINTHLLQMYPIYSEMNPNQKTALLSFTYNLGTEFIELETKKMYQHMLNGNLDGICYEMRDCDNTTVKNNRGETVKVKCPGLTRRRQAEMKLFKTAYN